ncbi:MAG: 1-acyl-sn-glycerol-3-phosphate acyltransferase [Actinomycetota bacterium]|nr:1-acyl-sn-glycerol-3-phosphate acyltransferase [Actinomycetota bacterium]
MSLVRQIRDMARGWRWTRRPLVPASAAPHVDEGEDDEFPTAWARTPPARIARDALQRFGLKPLVWSQVSPAVRGLDNLDALTGPVVFASNHSSHLDAPLLLNSLPPAWRRRTAVNAASDYFFTAWWRATATTLLFNAFPVDRDGGRLSELPGELLDDGWNLLLFPEGGRSDDGWVQGFLRGAGFLCLRHGIPAVPVAIRGAFAAMPPGRGWPRPGRLPVTVHYGPPVRPRDGERSGDFAQRLENAVARLLDEDEDSWWASLRRAAEDQTPSARAPDVARWRRVWEASRPLPSAGDRRGAWRR